MRAFSGARPRRGIPAQEGRFIGLSPRFVVLESVVDNRADVTYSSKSVKRSRRHLKLDLRRRLGYNRGICADVQPGRTRAALFN
jgi:hypothetical protein